MHNVPCKLPEQINHPLFHMIAVNIAIPQLLFKFVSTKYTSFMKQKVLFFIPQE